MMIDYVTRKKVMAEQNSIKKQFQTNQRQVFENAIKRNQTFLGKHLGKNNTV